MVRRALLLLVLAAAIALLAAVIVGNNLTEAVHHRVGPPPADLRARSVVIPEAGAQFLKGWFIPGRPGAGAVLLLHGVRSDRRQMIGRARFLAEAGFAVLLVDLPAHGESSGDRITFGARESVGVRAALGWLHRAAPDERIGVIGVSLGAASLVLSHASPAPDAVVLESMYPTIEDAAGDRIALRLGSPARALSLLLLWQLPLRIGVSADALRPVDDIGGLRAPVLIASGTLDLHTTIAETRRIYAAAAPPKQLWEVQGAGHVDLQAFDPERYRQRVLPFLTSNLRRRGRAASKENDE